MEIEIAPRSQIDHENLPQAIDALTAEDASLGFLTDHESGRTVLTGVGEEHLDEAITRLIEDFEIDLDVGAPEAPYRETVSREAKIDYTHKKHYGGLSEFARIKLVITPTEVGEDYSFESSIVGDSLPKEYISGVEKGIRSAMDSGPLAGFPVVGIMVSLIDGAYHDVDSSVLTFEIAARAAMREGLKKAGAKLLEPIVRAKIVIPTDCTRRVIGDLLSRRGVVQTENRQDAINTICAFVPVATMFGYISTLRSMSSGHGQFTMTFSHYQDVPKSTSDPDDPENFPPAIGMRA